MHGRHFHFSTHTNAQKTNKHMLSIRMIIPVVLAFTLASCTAQPGPKDLNPAEFETALQAGSAQLVDVRTPAEYKSGHLQDALLIDWRGSQFNEGISKLDKNKPVLLYCASGRRSASARDAMEKAGFKDVKHLMGGIGSWSGAGKPVVR